MAYQIQKSVTVNAKSYRIGLWLDSDGDWLVDTDGFGAIPLNALTGEFGDIARRLVQQHNAA
tara:strand:- start:103 stop:288 length:186 start_codon:yes stop_codon:yes gene_type:complete